MGKIKRITEKLKKIAEITGYAVFAVMFICGVYFTADQLNIVSQKVYAETPAVQMLNSVGYKYVRVYINGKYYLVFSNHSGSDIEVVPMD